MPDPLDSPRNVLGWDSTATHTPPGSTSIMHGICPCWCCCQLARGAKLLWLLSSVLE